MKKQSWNIMCKRNKKNRFCILESIVVLIIGMGTFAGCSLRGEKIDVGNTIPSGTNFSQMSGNWQIDFDKTEVALWGSGSSQGNSMEISETGAFSYYIGIGVGGTGQCEEEEGVITVKVESYEAHGLEQEILTLKHENVNGTEIILKGSDYLNRQSATFFIFRNYQHSTERMRYQK